MFLIHNLLPDTPASIFTVVAAVLVHTNSISVGMCQGFSAVLLPQLSNPNSTIKVDGDKASWIASLGVVSTPIGALAAGVLAEVVGRKSTIQLTALPFLAGWILMALSPGIISLCIGRSITGFAIGMASTCYVYVAEISLPNQRGLLSSLGPVFVSLGVLIVYYLGYLLHWQIVAVICGGVALASLCLIQLVPETPAWLLSKGKSQAAQSVLTRLRGSPQAAQTEILQMLQTTQTKSESISWRTYLEQSYQPTVWKPFLILVTYFLLQEASGLYIVLYYATNIFQEIGSEIDSSVESIIVGFVRLAMAGIGSLCIQKCNRRSLAIASGVGMGITSCLAAFYEQLFQGLPLHIRPISYFPSICILLNVCASMLGMLQLPWLMIGELFPLSVRGVMSGIVSSLAYFFIFAIIKLYPDLLSLLKLSGLLWFFATSSLLTIVFARFFLPETQGKQLIDIENSFRPPTKKVQPSGKDIESIYVIK